ncbi:YggS family pyridoxal phosphate-dependent enzyme [Salibacterium sp. K-3]
MDVRENLAQIEQEIETACRRSARDRADVHIIAVTKYVSSERALEAVDAGVQHIGENRLEGALEKWEACRGHAFLHFIGSLQSRKVKDIVDKYDYFHSLDRLSLAREFQKRSPENRVIPCMVQVNVSGEESKAGIAPDELQDFITELKRNPSVQVAGLMTMAPFEEDPEKTRPVFRKLRELRDSVKDRKEPHAPCFHLSMGMSNDFPVAVEEGATFIRIGTNLVGSEGRS